MYDKETPKRDKVGEGLDSIRSSDGDDVEINWEQPPPYSAVFNGDGGEVSVAARDDGRLDMSINTTATTKMLPPMPVEDPNSQAALVTHYSTYPQLNIVIQIVGSRGDVQPFIALGQALQASGHRIRIATHPNFKKFVESSNLEFFSIGGDPTDLMAYMVKNPSIIPTLGTLTSGDIGRKRKMVFEMLNGCWESCIMPDETTAVPFVADAIIANPPSFAHAHCAQALSVPLHLMFTMPWSPTRAFPHPLANLKHESADPLIANYLSYSLVDAMTWQGLGDLINLWRKRTLSLEPVPAMAGPGLAEALKVPFTYCWSPALIPKPQDWPSYIDVCGFFFREEAPYSPDAELVAFLNAGPTPIYIGFGSIVLDDPTKMTDIILQSVQACSVRAIISRGWSKLGTGRSDPNVLFLGDCPHEWLFKHVSAVIHHGGAGTTACGLLNGRPTGIVPFFGDQPFWANMVAAAGAGPRPIPHASLNSTNLSEVIRTCLLPQTASAASNIAAKMKHENGVRKAVNSFHRNLPIEAMSCDLLGHRNAVWLLRKSKGRTLKLSDRAAYILLQHKQIESKELELFQAHPIAIENPRWDPLSATSSALLGTIVDVSTGLWNTFGDPYKIARAAKKDGIQKHTAAGAASVSVGKGFVGVAGTLTKASLVDIPMALTEGLHQAPALYGEKPRDHGAVTDWKSGSTVAGKSLGMGFYDGIVGVVNEPIKGYKKHGSLGLLSGFAKGSLGLVVKPAAGMFGLMAYPAMGIYQSIRTAGLSPAQKRVLEAKKALSSYANAQVVLDEEEAKAVVALLKKRLG